MGDRRSVFIGGGGNTQTYKIRETEFNIVENTLMCYIHHHPSLQLILTHVLISWGKVNDSISDIMKWSERFRPKALKINDRKEFTQYVLSMVRCLLINLYRWNDLQERIYVEIQSFICKWICYNCWTKRGTLSSSVSRRFYNRTGTRLLTALKSSFGKSIVGLLVDLLQIFTVLSSSWIMDSFLCVEDLRGFSKLPQNLIHFKWNWMYIFRLKEEIIQIVHFGKEDKKILNVPF